MNSVRPTCQLASQPTIQCGIKNINIVIFLDTLPVHTTLVLVTLTLFQGQSPVKQF